MTNLDNSQSVKRNEESLASLFNKKGDQDHQSFKVITSSTDIGVSRNGGRNGSRFAPRSIITMLGRMTLTDELKQTLFDFHEVSNQENEIDDFVQAQKNEAQKIKYIIQNPKEHILHLGGGHDHIYPLLTAVTKQDRKLIIINIDAHADTRTDNSPNSGTPFRQFSNEKIGETYLVQLGLNQFSNSFSTLSDLKNIESYQLFRSNLNERTLEDLFLKLNSLITPETDIVLSLDVDALKASDAPGVSAINPNGLEISELYLVLKHYKKLVGEKRKILGIYELNPIFDTVSAQTSKTVASFIFEWLK